MTDSKFWVVSNLAHDIPEVVKSDLIELMVEIFGDVVKDNKRLKEAANIIYPLSQRITAIHDDDERIKNIILKLDLVINVVILMDKLLEKDMEFVSGLEYGITEIMNKILSLIEFVLATNICKDICCKQIKQQNGMEMLNKIDNGFVNFPMEASVSLLANIIINILSNHNDNKL